MDERVKKEVKALWINPERNGKGGRDGESLSFLSAHQGTGPWEQVVAHPGLNKEAEHFQARGKWSPLLSFLYSKGEKITRVTRVPNGSAH